MKTLKRYIIDSKNEVLSGRGLASLPLNSITISHKNDPTAKVYSLTDDVLEGISYTFDEKGGVIVFATSVNAVKLSNNKIINFLKQQYQTIKNKLEHDSKIYKIAKAFEVMNYSIGNFLKGKYVADNGELFTDKSLCLELIGVQEDRIITIGEEICKEFKQECVLVKLYTSNKIVLVKP